MVRSNPCHGTADTNLATTNLLSDHDTLHAATEGELPAPSGATWAEMLAAGVVDSDDSDREDDTEGDSEFEVDGAGAQAVGHDAGEQPKGTGRKGAEYRRWYDYEEKWNAVLAFDTAEGDTETRVQAVMKLAEAVPKSSGPRAVPVPKGPRKLKKKMKPGTLRGWITPKGRRKIEEEVGRRFPATVEGAREAQQARAKGGAGVRAPGRGAFVLRGRRPAEFEKAEAQLIIWCRQVRKDGKRLGSQAVRREMRKFASAHYGEAAKSFKASRGWLKRFMNRYKLTWRRRNVRQRLSQRS